jgi:uncharacterized Zn finger protein
MAFVDVICPFISGTLSIRCVECATELTVGMSTSSPGNPRESMVICNECGHMHEVGVRVRANDYPTPEQANWRTRSDEKKARE